MRRRLLRLLAIVTAVLVLSAATLPLWLGGVLGWAGGSRGLKFSRYERIGYSRFALYDADLKIGRTHITATRLELDTPLVWAFRRGPMVGGKWTVEVTPPPANAPVSTSKSKIDGWRPLQALLEKIASQVDRYEPSFTTEAGLVRWPDGELTVDATAWANRTLTVKALKFKGFTADGNVAIPGDVVKVALQGTEASINLETRGADVKGEAKLWEQPATLTGKYGEHGWLPDEAALIAEQWNVPGDKLRLNGVYTTVAARGKVEWRVQKLVADITATAVPKEKSTPPLDVALRGQGDWKAFTVESVNATLPGVVAKLTAPVTIEGDGRFRESGARFTVEADLAKLPWLKDTKGTVTGEARWVAGVRQSPVVEFQFAARDVAAGEWTVGVAGAKGQFEWPRVVVSQGTLDGVRGEKLMWSGGWDFRAKEILAAKAEGQIRRATVARWVPEGVQFDIVTLKAAAAGPLAEVKHTGRVQADGVKVQALSSLDATATWVGKGAALESFGADVKLGATTLAAEGALGEGAVRLTNFTFTQGGAERLHLREPAAIRWKPTVQVEVLHLVGLEGALDAALAWGETGRIDATVKNFSSAWLSDLGLVKGPAWRVTSLALKGEWKNGPLDYSLQATGAVDLGEGKQAQIAATAQSDANGLKIENLSVVEEGQSVVKATGRIPLRILPLAAIKAVFPADGALALDVTTEPHAGFWGQLAALTGFELKEPMAVAHLTGTWAKPQGKVSLKAARIATDAARFSRPLPTLEDLDVELAADAGEVRLDHLTMNVEKQTVRAKARLPVAEGQWREFLNSPVLWARRGVEARLEIPEAEVAALVRFLPVFMAPKGKLQLDVTYKGGALGGSLKLQDAATRLLGPLGVLQDISADVVFVDRKVEFRSVTAHSGGQTVTLSGHAELPETEERAAATSPVNAASPAPPNFVEGMRFDITLKGDNLPFVRKTGILVRGDLDLMLTTPARGTPRITGEVRLRDSLFLQDIRGLLPGGVRTKATTPPYFSVDAAPYNAWRIDVAVRGEKFFKLRTALFTGVATARVQLSGTLGDPLARGEATVDEGLVKLPFASFAVQEGRVVLSPEEGLEPQLTFVGTVRRLGYDLKMEATGPASHPNVVFSSSPPLESGQIALMVTTGQVPHNEISVSETQRAAQIGAFVGQSLWSSLSGESDSADRLSISSGENVSQQGHETYNFEYRLSDRWSAIVEFDEYDQQNFGVKWRAYSKGGTEKSSGGSVKKKTDDEKKKEEKKP